MGIAINYSGRLKNATQLSSLITEVIDIAVANNWDYFVFEDQFESDSFSKIIDFENLFGIFIAPQNCEPLCFSFLSNGRICGILNFKVMQLDAKVDEILTYFAATKTQYAGAEIHKQLVLVLDYIAKKYFVNFECMDDASFWETRDEDFLKTNFEKSTLLIESFSTSLENTPQQLGEDLDDYLQRIAEITLNSDNENNNDEPILTLEEEIEFKKMKIALEHDGVFGKNENDNLPPELENKFLDYVLNFEEHYKNVKQISIYERIGKPEFKNASDLNDDEIIDELDRIMDVFDENSIALSVNCDYEDEDRMLYTFITEEFFNADIDDKPIPGMISHYCYEDFHPNNEQDIEDSCENFIGMFLNLKSGFYDEYHREDATNHAALNNFRDLFKKFKILYYEFQSVAIEGDCATATFSLDFWGKIHGTGNKITYSGDGSMTFKHQYGFWYVQQVDLPIV